MLRPPPDEELTRRLQAGDAAAFDELYRRYAARLAMYGGRLLGDRALGEDVAQATLLNAYQALRRGTEPRHVKAWLYRIAHNAALELLERRRELLPGETEERAGADGHANHAARGELLRAMQSLPERQQRVYLLREVQGLRIDEIAAEVGLSANQVEQSLFAARNRLAEFLVFGERLHCETLDGLDVDALGREGKRALKSHLRACASCRASRPAAAGKLRVGAALLPAQLLGLTRGWVTALIGGGAAPAAKVAAVAAAGVIAATAPVTTPKLLRVVESVTRPDVALAATPPELAAVGPPPPLDPWFERLQPVALLIAAIGPAGAAAAPPPHAAEPGLVPPSEPAVDEPAGEEPPAEEPPAEEPPAEEPPAEEPPAEEPPAEEAPVEPPAEEPAPHEPLAEEPAPEATPVEEPVLEEPLPEPAP